MCPACHARAQLLSTFVTRFIFNNVSRGLFEEHKSLYSFLVRGLAAVYLGWVGLGLGGAWLLRGGGREQGP